MSDVEVKTCADEAVVSKYKSASAIANNALKSVVAACVEDAFVSKICEDGDKFIFAEVSKIFKKDKDMKKGVAFPISLAINNCINHFSPLPNEGDQQLKNGDMVKIDVGAHIDGFIAVVAHTLVVGASADNKVSGKEADVILAAHYASEAALGFFKNDNENCSITEAINKIADLYSVKPVEGMISYQLQQDQIDGEKFIHQNPTGGLKRDVDKCKLENHEVYGMDVVMTTGKGIGREVDTKVTIYKKTEAQYNLKLKCSKEFYRKVNKDFGLMPFNLRHFEDLKKARMGVKECVSHKLVAPYPVLYEKPNELVAQFKYTVIIMPNGPVKITGIPLDLSLYESQVPILENPEIKAMLDACKKPSKSKKEPKPEVPVEEESK